MFHLHKWETDERWKISNYDNYVSLDNPVSFTHCIRQHCTVCGEEVIRKFEV